MQKRAEALDYKKLGKSASEVGDDTKCPIMLSMKAGAMKEFVRASRLFRHLADDGSKPDSASSQ